MVIGVVFIKKEFASFLNKKLHGSEMKSNVQWQGSHSLLRNCV